MNKNTKLQLAGIFIGLIGYAFVWWETESLMLTIGILLAIWGHYIDRDAEKD